MREPLQKVTAFVTRQRNNRREPLLFEHPHCEAQFPAGTVDPGETPEAAAIREVWEETGLKHTRIIASLGVEKRPMPDGAFFVLHNTPVYARPDVNSFDWAHIRRGIWLNHVCENGSEKGRVSEGFRHVEYIEHDYTPEPKYITYQITGWVPDANLTNRQERHFFQLTPTAPTPADSNPNAPWEQFADNHVFRPFWASLDALPALGLQQMWLDFALPRLHWE